MLSFQNVFFLLFLFLSLLQPSPALGSPSLLERYQIISPIKKSLKDVVITVQMKLKSGAPLDSILKLIDDLKTDVSEEQTRHDKVYNDQMLECQDEYKFRSQQVDDSSTALEKAIRERNSCNDTRIKDLVDYEMNQKGQKETQENLFILEEQINKLLEEFKTKEEDHNQALNALKSCLDILGQLFVENTENTAFSQLAKSTNELLLTSAKIYSTKHYASLLSIMAQISSQREILSDSSALEKIQELLTHLKENVLNSFQEYQDEEKQMETQLNDRKALLQEFQASLQENEKKIMKDIDDMDSCLSVENSIISTASDKKERNEGLLDSAKSMCDNFENEYKQATEARYFFLLLKVFIVFFLK